MAFRFARQNGIQVVVYLAPIRPIQPNPNLPAEVAKFRRDLPLLCSKYGVTCFDYTDAVEEKLWTNYPDNEAGVENQRDYAHFTGAAHRLIAEKLFGALEPMLPAWQKTRSQ